MTNMGFFRVAACSPAVAVGNCMTNALEIIKMAREAAAKGAELVVFRIVGHGLYLCRPFPQCSTAKQRRRGH